MAWSLISQSSTKIVKEAVLDTVDHKLLNEVCNVRSTSENIAAYFFSNLKSICKNNELNLEKVALWESQTSCIEVAEDDELRASN